MTDTPAEPAAPTPPADQPAPPATPPTAPEPTRPAGTSDAAWDYAGMKSAIDALPEKIAAAVRESTPTPPPATPPASDDTGSETKTSPTAKASTPGDPPKSTGRHPSRLARWWFDL